MLFLSQRPLTRGDVDRNLFVGREEELARLGRASRLGLNVLVLGARGAGVTSLLNQHARQLEDGGRRVSLVSGTAAESLAELATAIRIGVEGRRPDRTETALRHPEVASAVQQYARIIEELVEVKTIPGDPDPLASLRGVEDSLSEEGSEKGTEAEGSTGPTPIPGSGRHGVIAMLKRLALTTVACSAIIGVSATHLLTPASALALIAPAESKLGTWGVTYEGVRITTTIYQDGSSYRMEQVLVWNGNGDTIRERLSKRGERYYLPGGEWFVIDSGYLDLYDSSGLIWSARPVK